jgi:predicted DNA binding protein
MRIDDCHYGGYQTHPEIYRDGWAVTLVLSDDEVTELLSQYEPASNTSPSAADSRVIARTVAEALRQKVLGRV